MDNYEGHTHLSAIQIRVGVMRLADGTTGVWHGLMSLLSQEEIARAAKFHFEQHRREYIAAHALTRRMLSEAAGGAPQDWAFSTGRWGKPVVEGTDKLHFSLSHSDGLVACAISRNVVLGIDIESTSRGGMIDAALGCFAPEEQTWLLSLPPASRPRGFLRLWTLKEAFVKATGMGLSYGLKNFIIRFDPLRVSLGDQGESSHWRLHETVIGESHTLALAWRGPEAKILILERSLREII